MRGKEVVSQRGPDEESMKRRTGKDGNEYEQVVEVCIMS
jgi:hypothetical protein